LKNFSALIFTATAVMNFPSSKSDSLIVPSITWVAKSLKISLNLPKISIFNSFIFEGMFFLSVLEGISNLSSSDSISLASHKSISCFCNLAKPERNFSSTFFHLCSSVSCF
jgi:hypothetical protein